MPCWCYNEHFLCFQPLYFLHRSDHAHATPALAVLMLDISKTRNMLFAGMMYCVPVIFYWSLDRFKVLVASDRKDHRIKVLLKYDWNQGWDAWITKRSKRAPRMREKLLSASKSGASVIPWRPFSWNCSIRRYQFPVIETGVFIPCLVDSLQQVSRNASRLEIPGCVMDLNNVIFSFGYYKTEFSPCSSLSIYT